MGGILSRKASKNNENLPKKSPASTTRGSTQHFAHPERQRLHAPLCAEQQGLFNASVSAFCQAKNHHANTGNRLDCKENEYQAARPVFG